MEDWERVDITDKDIRDAQQIPSNFGLSSNHSRYEEIMHDHTWSLGPVVKHRDSTLLQESNFEAMMEILKGYPDIEDDWIITHASTWTVGWQAHLSFKIFEDDGETPSKAFKVIKSIFDSLSDYPVLDESDYSRREYEATLENIEFVGSHLRNREMVDHPPVNWVGKCFSWFWNNKQEAVENRDDSGGYPSNDDMIECLEALGLLKPEE